MTIRHPFSNKGIILRLPKCLPFLCAICNITVPSSDVHSESYAQPGRSDTHIDDARHTSSMVLTRMQQDLFRSCRQGHGPTLQDSDCLICHEPFAETTNIISHSRCNRSFCRDCFLSWCQMHGYRTECPICRAKLVEPSQGSPQHIVEDVELAEVRVNADTVDHDLRVRVILLDRRQEDLIAVLSRLREVRSLQRLRVAGPRLAHAVFAAFDTQEELRRARVEEELEDQARIGRLRAFSDITDQLPEAMEARRVSRLLAREQDIAQVTQSMLADFPAEITDG